jgi:histidine triad (HIT) family protein
LTGEETGSLLRVAQVTAGKIKEAFHPDFVCMYARGRRVPHTHIFLVPTVRGDLLDKFFNGLERAQESSKELAELRQPNSLQEVAARLLTTA